MDPKREKAKKKESLASVVLGTTHVVLCGPAHRNLPHTYMAEDNEFACKSEKKFAYIISGNFFVGVNSRSELRGTVSRKSYTPSGRILGWISSQEQGGVQTAKTEALEMSRRDFSKQPQIVS